MKKVYSPQELSPTAITINLKTHIVNDLKKMEKNTQKPLEELVTIALLMFIATHNDFLGKARS